MATENKALMTQAREKLAGHWQTFVLATLVMGLIIFIASFVARKVPVVPGLADFIVSFIIEAGFALGVAYFYLRAFRGDFPKIGDIFNGFSSLGRVLAAKFLVTLFVLLWTLLLIVPGIVAAYSYAMTFFILADDSQISPSEAIKKSKTMMNGHKWKLACLGFRFFGWSLLCILTLGIGFLWLAPYMTMTMAAFYEDIKHSADVQFAAVGD